MIAIEAVTTCPSLSEAIMSDKPRVRIIETYDTNEFEGYVWQVWLNHSPVAAFIYKNMAEAFAEMLRSGRLQP